MSGAEVSGCLSPCHDGAYETPRSGEVRELRRQRGLLVFLLDDHVFFFKKRLVVSRAAHSRVAEKQVQMN